MANIDEHLLDFKWMRLGDEAYAPTKNNGDIGWDLRCVKDENFKSRYRALGEPAIDKSCIELFSGTRYRFKTNIAIQLPPGYAGIIKPRSGYALKYGIDVLAGVVDNIYRGPVDVILINHGKKSLIVQPGDKIAQMVIVKECEGIFREVDELNETSRGDKGFGSSGK